MITLVLLFLITIVQNASFTLVSRARNSGSYAYNAFASVFSNGIWFVVVQQVVAKPNDVWTGIAYVAGATVGSVLMQWVAINYLEKKKAKPVSAEIVGLSVGGRVTEKEGNVIKGFELDHVSALPTEKVLKGMEGGSIQPTNPDDIVEIKVVKNK